MEANPEMELHWRFSPHQTDLHHWHHCYDFHQHQEGNNEVVCSQEKLLESSQERMKGLLGCQKGTATAGWMYGLQLQHEGEKGKVKHLHLWSYCSSHQMS